VAAPRLSETDNWVTLVIKLVSRSGFRRLDAHDPPVPPSEGAKARTGARPTRSPRHTGQDQLLQHSVRYVQEGSPLWGVGRPFRNQKPTVHRSSGAAGTAAVPRLPIRPGIRVRLPVYPPQPCTFYYQLSEGSRIRNPRAWRWSS